MIEPIIEMYGSRLKVAGDILNCSHLLTTDDAICYEKSISLEAKEWLCTWRDCISRNENWDAMTLKQHTENIASYFKIKVSLLAAAIRYAISGKTYGANLYEELEFLGAQSSLRRIDYCICGYSLIDNKTKEYIKELRKVRLIS